MPLELLKSKTGRILIESHRGMESDVPENSWPAIRLAHQLSADLIEVDVQLSQDGIAYLHHNYQLPDGRWCNQVSWKELQYVSVNGEQLPKLEDVLGWARDSHTNLSLDIKTFFKPEGILTKEVLRLIGRTNTEDNVLLLFFDHQELLQVKLAYPELSTRALFTGRLLSYSRYLQQLKTDSVSVSYGMLRPEDIEQIHSIGVAVALIECWNPDGGLLREADIDVFSYGNPAEARKILERQ